MKLYKIQNYGNSNRDVIFLYLSCKLTKDQNDFLFTFLNLSNLEISVFYKFKYEPDLEFLDFYGFEEII
jgi:hypothetical protein